MGIGINLNDADSYGSNEGWNTTTDDLHDAIILLKKTKKLLNNRMNIYNRIRLRDEIKEFLKDK